MNKQILDLRLKQNLSLTPQLQQAIKILNMNSLEIDLKITQMMAQNFMLNMDDDYSLEALTQDNDADHNEANDAELPLEEMDYDSDDWDDETGSDWSELQPQQSSQADYNLEETLLNQPRLSSILIEQIEQMPISAELASAAKIIVYHLDNDGYFREDLTALGELYELSADLLEAGLTVVRSCAPLGVGAENLEHCVNIQLQMLPPDTPHLDTLKQIMARYFHFIGKNPAMIRRRLNLSKTQYQQAITLLHSLNPTPGFIYNELPTQFIKPDIVVKEHHGISYIEATDNLETKLSINQTYAALVSSATEQDKTLLSAQLQEAKWFITALEKRAETIKQVAGIVVAMQQDFFQQGELAMKPLTRQQTAEILGIHESTVSRAVNGKYLLCKRGLFELRYFFSNVIENTIGEDQSTIAIKAMIAELIEHENGKKPLSDQKISTLLAESGHQIARRTVTKYREALHIPSSSARRVK